MERSSTVPALPATLRRPASTQRPADAMATGALHPLEARRLAAGFDTPAELADAAGLSRGGVVNIEQGAVAKARTSTVRALATALQMPLPVLAAELRDPAGGVNDEHPQVVVVAERFARKQRVRYVSPTTPGETESGTIVAGPEFGVGTCVYEVAWDHSDTTWTPASFIEAIA